MSLPYPERRGRQTVLIIQAGIDGIISPCIPYIYWTLHFFTPHHYLISFDLSIGPYKSSVGACYGKFPGVLTVAGDESAACIVELEDYLMSFGGRPPADGTRRIPCGP